MLRLLLPVLVPLTGAVVALLVRRTHRSVIGMIAAVITGLSTLMTAVPVWRDRAVLDGSVGLAGLEVTLVADGLAVAMLLMTGVVGLLASLFAVAHERIDPDDAHPHYWPLWLLLWAALHALFLAGDLFTLYLLLELVAVAGVALVVLGRDGRALLAGTRYFFAEFAASTTFLLGVALIWREAGTVVMADLPSSVSATPTAGAGLALMTVGLLLKIPLVPVHFWLPDAHSLSPSAVSPVLSALVVKTAFAVLIRLWSLALPDVTTTAAAQLLGGLATAAIIWGSLNALRVVPVKLLVAYSTVAQLGFMVLLVPLAQAGSSDGWIGGVFLAVSHAPAKAAALIATTLIVRTAPGDAVADLGGTAVRRPIATFAFGLAGLSLVGLPPSGGFVGKWYLLLGAIRTGQWWWIPVVVVGSLLTAAYLMRVVKRAFAPADDDAPLTAVRDRRDVIALLLALVAIVLGLRPTELIGLLEVGAPVPVVEGG